VSPRDDDRAATPSRVAVLERRGKFMVAEPFFGPGSRVAVSRDSRYGVGDLVLLRAPVSPTRHGRQGRGGAATGGRGQIARRIGRAEIAGDVLEALLLDRGLQRAFDPAVQREARESAQRAIELGGRRDFREMPTFTIDPTTARDYDDAISASVLDDGGWRVFVHIADVSAYVPPRSLVDREAYRRATSTYVPAKVEPMLPGELSNSACSLVPFEDRLAVTVEMVIRGDEVVSSAFHRSLIRSDVRLTYDQVDWMFAGLERGSDPWGPALEAARAAAAALGARRAAVGALALDSSEPEFSFDRAGNIAGVIAVSQTESHRLIEQLMIAANEQVAQFLDRRRVPALYRVHERPEPMAVERLIEQLASLDVPTPPVPAGHMTTQQAADLAGEVSQMVQDWVVKTGHGREALTRLVLRSLKQAYYDPVNRGHAGLRSASYCHFTSPIRRYPDLICHRALLSAIGGLEPAPESSWVDAAGPWCSQRERFAMTVERDADDIARCFLLEQQLAASPERAPVFDGEVVGLISAGAFIAFGEDLAFQGMLPVRRLRGDWWDLNEQGTALIGSRGGGSIRLGDTLGVRVDGIDAPRGRVDLTPGADSD
jgi:ribonuclease R